MNELKKVKGGPEVPQKLELIVKSCEKEKLFYKKKVSHRARNHKKSIGSERLEIKKEDSIGSHLSD